MSITLFTGKPGSGKSYRVVTKLLAECHKYYIFHNIDGLKHDFFADGQYIKRWDDIPGFLTLEKQKEICLFVQSQYKRPVLVVIDEANLNGFGTRNSVLLDWISYHRHLGQDVYLITQSANSINRDFVDRCQFEIRAVRGIATKQFIYRYMVGDESFKTDRIAVNKAMFSAYESFKVEGQKESRSPVLFYAVTCVIVALSLGFYQIAFGLPHLFGSGRKPAPVAAAAPVPRVIPVKHVVEAPSSPFKSLDGYSFSGVIGQTVYLQRINGGSVVPLSDLLPTYSILNFTNRLVTVSAGGFMYRISHGGVSVTSSNSSRSDTSPPPTPPPPAQPGGKHGK